MTCETFRAWYDTNGADAAAQPPEPLREHLQACPVCQAFVRDERVWQRVFATVPEVPWRRSLWPGVLAKIEARQAAPVSLSAAVWALGRLVVPVCAVCVLCLGGVTLWRGAFAGSQASPVVSSVLLEDVAADFPLLRHEPGMILQQWVEGTRP